MNKTPTTVPELSVILVCADRFAAVRRTIQHLLAQEVRQRLELVLVATTPERLAFDETECAALGCHQVVYLGLLPSMPAARAAGVVAARAPLVVFAEDHSFPQPGWAEALIAAHRGSWAAVGPVIGNANPATLRSWVQLFLTYGRWTAPGQAGEIGDLPGHNSSYKKDLLLAYGDELTTMLQCETVLHWDLRRRGQRLYLAPAARTRHVNVSRLRPMLTDLWWNGQVTGDNRAREGHWSRGQRLFYCLLGPLSTARRFVQIAGYIWRSEHRQRLIPRALPLLCLGLAARGLGEMAAFLFGSWKSYDVSLDVETDRERFLAPADLRALQDPPVAVPHPPSP